MGYGPIKHFTDKMENSSFLFSMLSWLEVRKSEGKSLRRNIGQVNEQ